MEVKIFVRRKSHVPDPESKALKEKLGKYPAVVGAQEGKYFKIKLGEGSGQEPTKVVDQLCKEVFSNAVIEEYSFTLDPITPDHSCGGLSV